MKLKIWILLMNIADKYWGCHQLPERSYFINGYQFPVCARCTGIIIGELFSLLFFTLNYSISFKYLLLSMIPMLLDGTIQYKTSYISTNLKRTTTGILFGFGFIQLIIHTILFIIPWN